MIRSELIARIAAQNPHLYARDVERVVGAILDRVTDALVVGDRVELRDFGAFAVRDREARTGRNPRSGQSVTVAAKRSVYFKPGKAMRARLNLVKIEPKKEVERLLRASRLQGLFDPGTGHATEYNILGWLRDWEDRQFVPALWVRRLLDAA